MLEIKNYFDQFLKKVSTKKREKYKINFFLLKWRR